jgi:hypothetical protein
MAKLFGTGKRRFNRMRRFVKRGSMRSQFGSRSAYRSAKRNSGW